MSGRAPQRSSAVVPGGQGSARSSAGLLPARGQRLYTTPRVWAPPQWLPAGTPPGNAEARECGGEAHICFGRGAPAGPGGVLHCVLLNREESALSRTRHPLSLLLQRTPASPLAAAHPRKLTPGLLACGAYVNGIEPAAARAAVVVLGVAVNEVLRTGRKDLRAMEQGGVLGEVMRDAGACMPAPHARCGLMHRRPRFRRGPKRHAGRNACGPASPLPQRAD
jgi:hypothetical protein